MFTTTPLTQQRVNKTDAAIRGVTLVPARGAVTLTDSSAVEIALRAYGNNVRLNRMHLWQR